MSSPDVQPRVPSPEALADHLRRHRPRRTSSAGAAALIGALVAVLVIASVDPAGPIALLPWAILIGLGVWLYRRAKRMQALQANLSSVYELTLTRRWDPALREGWGLLPEVATNPQAHAQLVSLIANCLQRLRAHDAAIVAFDHLLALVSSASPAARYLRLQRLGALLRADRLTDTADELSKLRTAKLSPLEQALFTVAALHQQIKTNHHADAVESAGEATAVLRPLGVDAAYGYALLAAAFRQTDQPDEARAWWRRATLLLPPATLAWELPELGETVNLVPAPAMPLGAAPPPPPAPPDAELDTGAPADG